MLDGCSHALADVDKKVRKEPPDLYCPVKVPGVVLGKEAKLEVSVPGCPLASKGPDMSCPAPNN